MDPARCPRAAAGSPALRRSRRDPGHRAPDPPHQGGDGPVGARDAQLGPRPRTPARGGPARPLSRRRPPRPRRDGGRAGPQLQQLACRDPRLHRAHAARDRVGDRAPAARGDPRRGPRGLRDGAKAPGVRVAPAAGGLRPGGIARGHRGGPRAHRAALA